MENIEIPYTKSIDSEKLLENTKNVGITTDKRVKNLRRLIKSKPIVRILEAHSAASGIIIENLEVEKEDGIRRFDGLWSFNLCDSTNKGKLDIEVVDLTSRIQVLNEII